MASNIQIVQMKFLEMMCSSCTMSTDTEVSL